MTAAVGAPAVTNTVATLYATTEKVSAGRSGKFSANVDDEALFSLISAGLVGVHRSGSRQRKGGALYDYRSHYRALRLNCPPRTVLAFGTPDRLEAKLASLGIFLCFEHARPQLSVGRSCQHCRGREGKTKARQA